jgi:hypothetical protein
MRTFEAGSGEGIGFMEAISGSGGPYAIIFFTF